LNCLLVWVGIGARRYDRGGRYRPLTLRNTVSNGQMAVEWNAGRRCFRVEKFRDVDSTHKEAIVRKVLVFRFSHLVFDDLFLDSGCVEQLLLLEGTEQALERFDFHGHAVAGRGGFC